MYFTAATSAVVLAFFSIASATPVYPTNGTATASRSSTSTSATATANPLAGLSKTAQILLSDTRADAINNVLKDNSDFVFKFKEKRAAKPPGKGGVATAANRKTFPALTGTGVGAVLAELGPCGFNTPHVHPRAHELLFMVEGEIVSSMFPENGVNVTSGKPREILNNIKCFESTIYYQGSVHSQYNPSCNKATFVGFQSSEDFGTGQVAQELFGTSNEALQAVFGNTVEGADIEKFRSHISTNVALGVEQCLKRCKISKR